MSTDRSRVCLYLMQDLGCLLSIHVTTEVQVVNSKVLGLACTKLAETTGLSKQGASYP